MPTFDDALQTLDERFIRARDEGKIPGVTWGVVRDGRLVHSAGAGTIRDGEDGVPDEDSIFRIASMTKSFTAATVLHLRDAGRLRLDDPVADWVPQLASWRGATADSPPVTIRQLLTMSAGLPTDDPWGDRQQALELADFGALLEAGPVFAWPPGTTFEYSNLGYGILGRVISAAGGAEYREVVRDRILMPLGMTSTAYREEDLPAERVAQGYVRRDDVLVPEGMDAYGAFASMGGLFTTVRDLATWVAGFLDAFPARDDPDEAHPLRRATRREMQQMHRVLSAEIAGHPAHEPPAGETAGYGLGLFLVSTTRIGLRVGHGGGYPGFGSYMTWHPASGIGLIVVGNSRYAPIYAAAKEQLTALVEADGVVHRRPVPLPATEASRPVAEGLLAAWDDSVADAAFAMNMDLDEPREARRAAAEKLAVELGPFHPDTSRHGFSMSPAHAAWWLRGERGWVRVGVLVTPEPQPRLQALRYTAVPDPSDALRGAAQALVVAASQPDVAWPATLTAGPALDTAPVFRSLRAAAARLGSLRLGLPTGGDGTTTADFEVWGDGAAVADAGPGAPATISVTLDAASGAVTTAGLSITDREAPVEGW